MVLAHPLLGSFAGVAGGGEVGGLLGLLLGGAVVAGPVVVGVGEELWGVGPGGDERVVDCAFDAVLSGVELFAGLFDVLFQPG